MMSIFDFVIKNASVYDGSGAKPKIEDVFIKDGKITHIGVYHGEITRELTHTGAAAGKILRRK